MITGITFCLIVTMANLVVGAFCRTYRCGSRVPAADHFITIPSWDWARTEGPWPLALVLLSFLVMQCMNRKQLF